MAWTTPFTFTAGFQPTAAKWNEQIRDNLNIVLAAGASAFTSFTTTWTAVTTNPTAGNATISGGYTQIGKLCVFHIYYQAGSTTTFGSGEYRWALPVTAEAASRGGGKALITFGGITWYNGQIDYNSTTTLRVGTGGTTLTWATPTSPFTWAANDLMTCYAFFEAA